MDGATLRLVEEQASEHNRRFRVELCDGLSVECVLYRGDTLCVSSQVGCAVGCPFCASGANGLRRPLTFEELRGQVDEALRRTAAESTGTGLRRVTVSGVGEPLHNAGAVEAFVHHCRARGLAPSLTTAGGPLAKLAQALHWPHNGLTLSVHAGSEATRARLVPRGPRLAELFGTLEEQWPRLSNGRRRKLALAYLLLAGENDHAQELDAFAARVSRLPGARVHLYAYNPVAGSNARGVGRADYLACAERLRGHGLYVQLSSRARTESNGACGTLVARLNRAARE